MTEPRSGGLSKFNPLFCWVLLSACLLPAAGLHAQAKREIPAPLKIWEDWATWGDKNRNSPTPYNDAKRPLNHWPDRLSLEINRTNGQFELGLTVFAETWITLPGGRELWPLEVTGNNAPLAVLEHNQLPSVRLAAGTYLLKGKYRWDEMPQRIALPREIGLLSLKLEGAPVPIPSWDAEGFLWLKRSRSEEADKDFLAVKAYRLIEDGIPMWLRTEIELSVSGKSREESLGLLVPEGWQLSQVESPIPVAIDDAGRVKAQVRAGKWTVKINAFRLNHSAQFRYREGTEPALAQELVAFRAQPEFRMVEITGLPLVDVSQTTFPVRWRDLPVYSWETRTPFSLEERMRGMGLQKTQGLQISRELWLDENGHGLTFRDRINGDMQQIWRLDIAPGQELGSVTSEGQGQLITRNPSDNTAGVEIRKRNLKLEATGRQERAASISATGWKADADRVSVSLNLPPGWRLFALFGADYVHGDWLTAWTLLDLFLLLVFSLAVYRLWGIPAGILALLAFGLAYHEPGAPRYTWLFLLMPLALLRVVPKGALQKWITAWKYTALLVLLFVLIPFVTFQIQYALYPQLESVRDHGYFNQGMTLGGTTDVEQVVETNEATNMAPADAPAPQLEQQAQQREVSKRSIGFVSSAADSASYRGGKVWSKSQNLNYDAKARIQTGPGVPEWHWRQVQFGWDGPVVAAQKVRPVLISLNQQRALSIVRIALLVILAGLLLDVRRYRPVITSILHPSAPKALALLLAAWILSPVGLSAQIPDKDTLETLRTRLLETSDAYPNAADIPSVALKLNGRNLVMDAEIHTALQVAVPLPGRLPSWSPVRVSINGKPSAVLRRDRGYLWVALPGGVHQVSVEGLLPDVTEWEWSFLLAPRKVSIASPGWTFNGVKPDGVPEQQVFFTRQEKTAGSEASYDRQDFKSLASVERRIELGLVWQVTNIVTRLSPAGKALSLRIPVLPGEKVLSSNVIAKDGFVEARLGAFENEFVWVSELPVTEHLPLVTQPTDTWVESWHLIASPVWNVSLEGLAPTFETGNNDLVPVWRPWPGEKVNLTLSRPEAVSGATVTVHKARHEMDLGKRQRVSSLNLDLQCSLGEDFALGLPDGIQVAELKHNGREIPVRKDGTNIMVPLTPGRQSLFVKWKKTEDLAVRALGDEIRLPVEAANVTTHIQVGQDRWVLWTGGPLRGPAVRFWGILIVSILAARLLSGINLSPLRTGSWVLLIIGLSQVHLACALVVVAWLFFLSWRGRESFQSLSNTNYNILQVVLVLITLATLGIFIAVVAAGLLGRPEMFIVGNNSTSGSLLWYQARTQGTLPQPTCLSVSIWWYRLLMLAWALWLATSLIGWLKWAWQQFNCGPLIRRSAEPQSQPPTPPPLKP